MPDTSEPSQSDDAARELPESAPEKIPETTGDGLASIVPQLKVKPLDAGLYLTAMPIGNAEDITLRALRVLSTAAVIVCEDTRHSGHLLTRYGIDTPRIPYHEHNALRMRPQILRRMAEGQAVALISDAGTPLISDPGYKLVREAQSMGIFVTSLPGASAATAGLIVSGLPSDRFMFAGFPPPKAASRDRYLADLAAIDTTLIFYESARRLPACLAGMAAAFGARDAAVVRELTKRFEEVRRGPLTDLAAHYRDEGPPRGEIVVVVGPPSPESLQAEKPTAEEALTAAFATGASLRDAVDRATSVTGLPRRTVYASALAMKRTDTDGVA
ncbi:16S rRNA (cytidine(1402)-2'-O)-methyltransferase [Fodinicurvata sp. EGI_FJ10296]|uniref:16S rRNA (cytidine(1402)-2'-O)-methyltransferase n=1 Tax=Fodinicurvata sp. EGI_FJ10296 TaxID=3231908 RepID=UPI0034515CC9